MIDISNEIFDAVAKSLRSVYQEITVVGENVEKPAKFPTVTIDEIRNIPVHLDSAAVNKYARITIKTQTFCTGSRKRQDAREIFNTLDNTMMGMGLFMKTYTTMPTIYNSEVYCITATHEGVVGVDGVIYRG